MIHRNSTFWDGRAEREFKLYRTFMPKDDAEHAAAFRLAHRLNNRFGSGHGSVTSLVDNRDMIGPDDVEEWYSPDGRPAHIRCRPRN